MSKLTIPKNYSSALNLHDTQLAIKTVKDFFQGMLAQRLSLTRVSAPLFVDPTTGLNDNLNGYERPVTFGILEQGDKELRSFTPLPSGRVCIKEIRLLSRRGHLHRYECHKT